MKCLKDLNKVFIIAEMSGNHNGNLDVAIDTIRAAKEAGADAIKLQTYRADTITIESNKKDFMIDDDSYWSGQYLYDLYLTAYTPWKWHKKLFEVAKEENIIIFSAPFDHSAVDFLEDLNTPIYKIASAEITDIPLIEYIASKQKPIIISTGMANKSDIELAIKTCESQNNNNIALLKCTSSYPTPVEESNVIMVKDLSRRFGFASGISDHTLGINVPLAATCFGAKIIEKHFIIDKSIGGPDAFFSLDRTEFTQMVNSVREIEKSIGRVSYELTENQKKSRKYIRSLYITEDMKIDDKFTSENIKSIRPGYGLHPKYYNEIIGCKINKNAEKGTALSWDLISK